MMTELIKYEAWAKKLTAAGYRVIPEAWSPMDRAQTLPPAAMPRKQ